MRKLGNFMIKKASNPKAIALEVAQAKSSCNYLQYLDFLANPHAYRGSTGGGGASSNAFRPKTQPLVTLPASSRISVWF